MVVEQGLTEGDEVILNPIAFGEPELADSEPADESESGEALKAAAKSNDKKQD